MSDLRKAAQTALEAWDRSRQWPFPTRPDKEFDALRAAVAQPEQEPYPLPDSLYPDSKDWIASDYAGRVEWLHFMYESKKREVEQLETAQPERKPLTDAEVYALVDATLEHGRCALARAIERAHGIGDANEP
jgi:hypothetical protein